ncbi:MAG: hypothetical protein ACI9WU_003209 [Myxococcota bacterium]
MRRPLIVLGLTLLLLAGCSIEPNPSPLGDQSAVSDVFAPGPFDAGQTADAATTTDAGVAADTTAEQDTAPDVASPDASDNDSDILEPDASEADVVDEGPPDAG